jgi:hypothetical protein
MITLTPKSKLYSAIAAVLARFMETRSCYVLRYRVFGSNSCSGPGKVRLMTNNPEKIAALTKAGLEVISDHRVLGRPTAENVSYLAAKRDRAGHFIDLEGMLACSNKD